MKDNRKIYTSIGIILVLLALLVGGRELLFQPKETTSSSADYTSEDTLTFRNSELLNEHYEKHGKDMGFSSAEAYEQAASAVVSAPSVLHKTEAEDGDDVYYLERTNEFVIVSVDGYIRTYFQPHDGIDYYNRQ